MRLVSVNGTDMNNVAKKDCLALMKKMKTLNLVVEGNGNAVGPA